MHSNGKTSFFVRRIEAGDESAKRTRASEDDDVELQPGPGGALSPVSQTLRKKKEIYKKTRFLIGRMFPDHERRVRLLMARTC